MTTARALRDQGQDAAIAADVAAHKGYGDYIRQAIEEFAVVDTEPWTCDQVRQHAQFLAEQDGSDFRPSDNLLPAYIGSAVGQKQIVRVSDATSTRRSRRAARVGRYLGARYAVTPRSAGGVTPAP